MHERVRQEFWGYAPKERLDNADLIAEQYQGIRPRTRLSGLPGSFAKGFSSNLWKRGANGYPTHGRIRDVPGRQRLGFYFAHPEASYFGVGRIGRDQVEDYANRREVTVETAERWLSANLGYSRS